MIKKHYSNGRDWVFVEVPKDGHGFRWYAEENGEPPIVYYWRKSLYRVYSVLLSEGNYKIICLSDEATEEQAMEVVEGDGKGYKEYCYEIPYPCHVRPKNSLLSLIKSLFPSTDNRILILEKLKA